MTTYKGTRTAKIRRIIGDDYYDLRLRMGELVDLQEACNDRGPLYIANKLREFNLSNGQLVGDWNPLWVYHTIRLGLIGAEEMSKTEAVRFCDKHIRDGFIMDYVDIAADAIYAAMIGHEDDPVTMDDVAGKATTEQTSPSHSVKSDGANITDSLD